MARPTPGTFEGYAFMAYKCYLVYKDVGGMRRYAVRPDYSTTKGPSYGEFDSVSEYLTHFDEWEMAAQKETERLAKWDKYLHHRNKRDTAPMGSFDCKKGPRCSASLCFCAVPVDPPPVPKATVVQFPEPTYNSYAHGVSATKWPNAFLWLVRFQFSADFHKNTRSSYSSYTKPTGWFDRERGEWHPYGEKKGA